MTTDRINDPPERIYLIVGDIPEIGCEFKRLQEVLWCEDRHGPHDLEYTLQKSGRRRVDEDVSLQRLKRRVTSEFLASCGVMPTGRMLEALRKALDAVVEGALADEATPS